MTNQQYAFLGRLDWKLYMATSQGTSIGHDISFIAYKAFKSALTEKARCRWNFQDITFSVIELADVLVESD
jgi:hypothetical protein